MKEKICISVLIDLLYYYLQKLFHQFDIDKSGMLSSFDLRRCVAAAGEKFFTDI